MARLKDYRPVENICVRILVKSGEKDSRGSLILDFYLVLWGDHSYGVLQKNVILF